MKVLFCHGKEGSPNGKKATMVKENFQTCQIPKLKNSFETIDFLDDLTRIEKLAERADVIVGSSRGGALVAQARTGVRKVLIAPAWKKFQVVPYLTKEDIILHSKQDDLVPYEDSVRLANMFGCRLIECGLDHRMSDDETLKLIKNTIEGEL
jgi:predicted esterase YcpF (UPF0227 family)